MHNTRALAASVAKQRRKAEQISTASVVKRAGRGDALGFDTAGPLLRSPRFRAVDAE
jgi:hypothetical protein